ncbi:MAG: hydrogen peroxide-inducible genes activator [Zoogloeaceae bacterium]|jgi:LysR family hydrogen peroxide-inducible transcriptional activator|nr:hydrogen peroxide-inducible genes activator [Zoogloeaceae bacterium]
MTLTELRYIVALAKEKHFGRAAERCHVSQPTLSVALKKLEGRLEVALFERTPGDVRPTPVGERVCAQAEKVLAEVVRVEELAQTGKDPLNSLLRLGVIYTIAPYLLPQLILSLHALAPEMHLYLQENYTHRLAESLKNGDLDAAILAAPFEEPGIVTRPLYDEPFMAALPAGHALAARKELAREELDPSQLLILGQGNCFRDQVISACPQFTTPGNIEQAMEGNSLETMRHMVASGTGIAIVPASAAMAWPANSLFVTRPFQAPAPSRRVMLAWRVTFPRPRAIDALYEAVRQSPPAGTEHL